MGIANHWIRDARFPSALSIRPSHALMLLVGTLLVVALLKQAVFWGVVSAAPPWGSRLSCDVVSGACWPFLTAKIRLILFGRFPYDAQWRPAFVIVAVLCLIAWTMVETFRGRKLDGRRVAVVWTSGLVGCWALLSGGFLGLEPVQSETWDGLALTLLLATLSSFLSFWLGVLLALGRRLGTGLTRTACAGYIELIRSVPLVGLLFMVFVLTPYVTPRGWQVTSPFKALVVLSLFLAAYMAEAIRGALQTISQGQFEAAKALGLGRTMTLRLVVLPQALRKAIPSLANIFITAIKDTSLVFTVGMLDLLGTSSAAISDPSWGGRYVEIFVFAAVCYGLLCYSVSWYSRAIEARLAR